MASADELVAQAQQLAKSGDKATARTLVIQALQADRDHLQGWWLAAQVAKTREEAIKCLQQVLRLSPGDARATAAIKRLQSESAPAPAPAQPAAPTIAAQIRKLEQRPANPPPASSDWSEAAPARSSAPVPVVDDEDDSWPKGLSRPGKPLQTSVPAPKASAADDSWRSGLGQAPQPATTKAVAQEPVKQDAGGPNWLLIGAGVLVALCVVCGIGAIVLPGAISGLGSLVLRGSGNSGFSDPYDTVGDTTIAVGGSARGTLATLNDAYNVRFQGTQGQSYTIQVNGQGGCDPRATVYGPGGEVAYGDDENGYNALIRMTANASTEYVVRVDVWTTPCTFDVWVSTP